MKRSTTLVILAALCAAAFAQAWGSARQKSLTFDELVYIPVGYSYVVTGDFRLNPEHPPLIKLLSGAAMLPLRPRLPLQDSSWVQAAEGVRNTQWNFGRAFFSLNRADIERLVLWARLPVMLLTVLLVVGVFLFGRDLYGPGAGLVAAALCAFDPNILAHGRLATNDLGLTAFVLLAVWSYRRLGRRPGVGNAVLAAVLLAAALLSKFSGLFLLPLYAAWAVTAPFLPGAAHAVVVPDGVLRGWAGRPRMRRLAWSAGTAAVVVSAALLLVSLGYLAPGRVDIYFRNLRLVTSNIHAAYLTYFHGRFYDHHLWYYFLATFVLKTPLALLILLVLRAASRLSGREEREEAWPDRLLLFGPVVIWFLLISWKASQFGLRYILPVYPFLFVYAAGIVASPLFKRRAVRVAVGGLGAWLVASSLWAYPNYIPYFNALAGGPSHGIEWLDDSNVDWGEDLLQLRSWLAARKITDAHITGMALYDPALYGIPGTYTPPAVAVGLLANPNPPPGVYAVSVHLLNRAKLAPNLPVDPLKDLRPVAVIGHTLWVFDIK